MKISKTILFPIVFLSVFSSLLFGAVITVPTDVPTIQEAIQMAEAKDTILVEPGVYTENLNFEGKAISLLSLQGPEATVIDGSNPSNPGRTSAVSFDTNEGPLTVLRGFTISGGGDASVYGGGLFCESTSPTIENCIVTGNRAQYGAGLYCGDHASPAVRQCVFSENEAESGAGAFFHTYSSPLLQDCFFVKNRATWISGGFAGTVYSAPVLQNCVFSENTAERAAVVYLESEASPQMTNCVFWGNRSESWGAMYCKWYASPTVRNSVFWNETEDEILEQDSTAEFSYCDIRGGWPGTGNIDAVPLFVSPKKGDFHIQFQSPCIDAGGDFSNLPEYDFEGEARIFDGNLDSDPRIDIGADEFFISAVKVREGNVNRANGEVQDVLFINGSSGNEERVFSALTAEFFTLSMECPPAGPVMAPFSLYAVPYENKLDHLSSQPFGIGLAAFPTPLNTGNINTSPETLVNTLGALDFGVPYYEDASPAPTTVFHSWGLPRGTYTLQGFIVDMGSTGPSLSVTNAIVVKIL